MRFADFAQHEDPAYEVFNAALQAVFDEGDNGTENIDRLSIEARLVYLLWAFDGEIHNGGFDQLFFNSLGNHWKEILEALEVVGATRSRELLALALSRYPGAAPSQDRAQRWSQNVVVQEQLDYEEFMNGL